MSESVKGFCATLVGDPPRIQVKWDRIAQADFECVEVAWWCFGDREAEKVRRWTDSSQYLIDASLGETYVVAARAHFTPTWAFPVQGGRSSTEWAYAIVEVPRIDDQYTDLGQVTVIDTPRGPAILLGELWDARGQ